MNVSFESTMTLKGQKGRSPGVFWLSDSKPCGRLPLLQSLCSAVIYRAGREKIDERSLKAGIHLVS